MGYIAAAVAGLVDFSAVSKADWVGLPTFTSPTATWSVIPMFLPVVLVAENVGHVRSVADLVGDDSINQRTGMALTADGLATALAGVGGGSATTTYGENIGVMTATRVFSTAAYWVAGAVAILLSLSPKVGALLNTIPAGVLGGVTVALYGLIGLIGVNMDHNQADFNLDQHPAPRATIACTPHPDPQGSSTFTHIASYHRLTGGAHPRHGCFGRPCRGDRWRPAAERRRHTGGRGAKESSRRMHQRRRRTRRSRSPTTSQCRCGG